MFGSELSSGNTGFGRLAESMASRMLEIAPTDSPSPSVKLMLLTFWSDNSPTLTIGANRGMGIRTLSPEPGTLAPATLERNATEPATNRLYRNEEYTCPLLANHLPESPTGTKTSISAFVFGGPETARKARSELDIQTLAERAIKVNRENAVNPCGCGTNDSNGRSGKTLSCGAAANQLPARRESAGYSDLDGAM